MGAGLAKWFLVFVSWIDYYFEMEEEVKKKRLIDYTFFEHWELSEEEQERLENEATSEEREEWYEATSKEREEEEEWQREKQKEVEEQMKVMMEQGNAFIKKARIFLVIAVILAAIIYFLTSK